MRKSIHAWRAQDPYTKVLYAFNSLSLIGGSIYGMYYGVFLYKQTFSLTILAIDGLLGGFGVWVGYLIGVYFIKRSGYGRTIRTAFALWAAIALVTALVTNHIAEWFMVIAFIKALPAGIYGAAFDTMLLRDIKSGARASFFQFALAVEFISSIILPAAVGALIKMTAGYEWAFVLSGLVFLGSFAVRCNLPKPDVKLHFKSMVNLFKQPLYPYQAANRTMAVSFNSLNAFALTIVPFLLLKDEFSMGVLTSVAAVVATVVSLSMRRMKNRENQLTLGYAAHTIKGISAGLFVIIWTAPLLAAWQIVGKVLTPLHDPIQQSLDIQSDSLILGKQASRQAMEINLVNNALKFIGSTIAFGGFILITSVNPAVQKQVLEVLLASYAVWRLANLTFSKQINTLALQSSLGHIKPRELWLHKMRFVSYAYLLKVQSRFGN